MPSSEKDLFRHVLKRVSKGPLTDTYPYWYIVEKRWKFIKKDLFSWFLTVFDCFDIVCNNVLTECKTILQGECHQMVPFHTIIIPKFTLKDGIRDDIKHTNFIILGQFSSFWVNFGVVSHLSYMVVYVYLTSNTCVYMCVHVCTCVYFM